MKRTPLAAPNISNLLDDFFAGYQPGAPAAVQARIVAVRNDLTHHLDIEGPRILTTGQLAILNTEREFNRDGAFARTMHADDLYYALQHYLDPAHAFEEPAQRETQLDVVAALAASLWNRQLVSEANVSECTLIEFDIALKRGRDALKTNR
jgi:hypothetical protein